MDYDNLLLAMCQHVTRAHYPWPLGLAWLLSEGGVFPAPRASTDCGLKTSNSDHDRRIRRRQRRRISIR